MTKIAAFGGLLFSLLLVFFHFYPQTAFCDFGSIFACEAMLVGPQSEFLGTPISAIGATAFLFLFIASFAKPTKPHQVFLAVLWVYASLFAIYLILSVEVLGVGKLCLYCTIVHLFTFLGAFQSVKRGWLAIRHVTLQELVGHGLDWVPLFALLIVFPMVLFPLAAFVRGTIAPPQSAFPIDVAECLVDKGWVMYGSKHCGHCHHQLRIIGDEDADLAKERIQYVECGLRGEAWEGEACNRLEIGRLPTWMNEQLGVRREGTRDVVGLKELCGLEAGSE